jgi:hypothetical protein
MNRPLKIGCVLIASIAVPNCGGDSAPTATSPAALAGQAGAGGFIAPASAAGSGGTAPIVTERPGGSCNYLETGRVPAAGAGGEGGEDCHFIGIVE